MSAAEPAPISWLGFDVMAGDAGRLDAALHRSVAPVVNDLELELWSFVRWTSPSGTSVRLALGGEQWDDEDAPTIADRLATGLPEAA